MVPHSSDAEPPESTDANAAGVKVGPFVLQRRIGVGGMGEVWRGDHESGGFPAAIKILRSELARDEWVRRAFRNEVRATARLHHPRVVMVYDHGELSEALSGLAERGFDAGSPWLAMELVEGHSLMRARGRLDWEELYGVLLSLLDALAHAHARGLIHRDLKPGNALYHDGHVKLVDFGLVRMLEEDDSDARAVLGTAPYMAPEQFRGDNLAIGPWTDLYALGGLAWTLVCGSPPFGLRRPFKELREAHLEQAPPPLDPLVLVPESFELWMRRLLEKDPARRFRRAADAAWALRRVAPVRARVAQVRFEPDYPTLNWSDAATVTAEPGEPEVEPTLGGLDPDERPPMALDWRQPLPPLPPAGVGMALFGLRDPPITDREEERDALWASLVRASEGGVQLALLQGQAGGGKSRIARWVCERAHELGAAEVMTVSHGLTASPRDGVVAGLARLLRCADLPRERTVRRCVEALRALGLNEPDDALALAEMIRPATTEEAARERVVRPGGERERRELLSRILDRIGRERPLIVRVDDVQWGPDSLALASFMLQRSMSGGVLWLMTARDVAADTPEAHALSVLLRHKNAARVAVGPLGAGARAELLRSLGLRGAVAGLVEERAGGNPLFSVQLVGDWIQRGWLEAATDGLRLREGVSPTVPDDVHEVLQGRVDDVLAAHGPAEQAALELAAVLGATLDWEEWTQAAHLAGVFASVALVEELLRRGLAECEPEGPQAGWSFAHALLRDSLVRRARESGRLNDHHRACVAMLRERQSRDPRAALRLGFHLLALGEREEALGPLAKGAWRCVIDSEYAMAERALAAREEAIVALNLPENDRRGCIGWLMRARVARRLGDHETFHRFAVLAEQAARAQGWSDLLCQALRERARLAAWTGDRVSALGHLEEAMELASAGADLAWCQRDQGLMLAAAGMSALDPLTRAFQYFVQSNELFGAGSCARGLAETAIRFGQDPTPWLDEAERLLTRSLPVQEPAQTLVGLAEVRRLRGDVDAAADTYEQALRRLHAIGSAATDEARLGQATLWLSAGRHRAAHSLVSELAAEYRERGRAGWLGQALALQAEAEAQLGRWEDMERTLGEALGTLHGSGMVDRRMVEALLACGRLAAAAREPLAARLAWRLVLRQAGVAEGAVDPAEIDEARGA